MTDQWLPGATVLVAKGHTFLSSFGLTSFPFSGGVFYLWKVVLFYPKVSLMLKARMLDELAFD